MDIINSFIAQDYSKYTFTKLNGDCSVNKVFYSVDGGNSIVLLVKIATDRNYDEIFIETNGLPLTQYQYFVHTFNLLNDHGLCPSIICSDDEHGIVVMEYIGDTKLCDVIDNEMRFQAIDCLIKLQAIPPTDMIGRRKYSAITMRCEINQSIDNIDYLTDSCKSNLHAHLAGLLDTVDFTLQCVCHRDYQSRNIMITNDRLQLIDLQDCCIGHPIWDLACLLFESNHVLSQEEIKTYANYYYNKSAIALSYSQFHIILDIFSMIRVINSYSKHRSKFINGRIESYKLMINNRIYATRLGFFTKYNIIPVILAAGRGKRMNSPLPKVLCKVNGTAMIDTILDNIVKIEPTKIILVVGYCKELIMDHCKSHIAYPLIEFVSQDEQLGTAHAVHVALPVIALLDCSVLTHFGDNPTVKYQSLIAIIKQHAISTGSVLMSYNDTMSHTKCGRIVRNGEDDITMICEDPNETYASDEFLGGVQIHTNTVLQKYLPLINNNNNQNEYYLTDLVGLISREVKLSSLIVDKFELANVNSVADINYVEEMIEKN